MKRKANLFVLFIVLFVTTSISGIVVFNVKKQLNSVINDEKTRLNERILEEFRYFGIYLTHLEKQTTYAYKNRVIKAANYLNKNWKHGNEVPDSILKKVAKNIEVDNLLLINKNAIVVKSTLKDKLNYDFKNEGADFIEFFNNIFDLPYYKTYNISVNPKNNRIYMYSYYAPKNALYTVNTIINFDADINPKSNYLINNILYKHINDIIPKVNKIVIDMHLFNLDDTTKISILDNKTELRLNSKAWAELLNKGEYEIETENGVKYYYIIKPLLNITGLPNQIILYAEFDYTVRYGFALKILMYIIITILILLLLVFVVSPAIIDKMFFDKIAIINFNLNALRFAKYDILKSFKGNDELSVIAENIEYVKESVIEREKQLKESKIMAEVADKLKSAFLANMSHEIRTPLNAVVGFSQLLRDANPSPSDVEKYVDLINSNSNKLLQIISDIIDLSQIESGQLKIIARPVCLNELFNELYAFAQTKLYNENLAYNTKSINILVEHGEISKGDCMTTDPFRIKQIMEQLIDNAIKFTCQGEIRIGFKITDDIIELFVRDTGIGIAEDDNLKIFGRFVQAADYMTREYGGTGLGLAICSELVRMLGGTIGVDSTINQGSIFSVKLPYNKSKQDNIGQKPHS